MDRKVTAPTTLAASSSREELVQAGLMLAHSASVLLMHSGVCLQRCLQISAGAAASGRSFHASLAALKDQWSFTSPEPESQPLLDNARRLARVAASQASQSALEIQAIIGQPGALPAYPWRSNSEQVSMHQIHARLTQTMQQIAEAGETFANFKEELTIIQARIDVMLGGASANLTQAKNTIVAAESILRQATNFLRTIERVCNA